MVTPAELKDRTDSQPRAAETPANWAGNIGQALVIGALLVVAFWPILLSVYGSWFDPRAYMEHGILVVPAAAYMVWAKRDELQQVRCRPSAWGIPLLIWGALQAMLGLTAQWIWVARIAFLISLAGCIVLVFGFEMLRKLSYPVGTLLLMITPPDFIFERLTLSLQLLASRLGAVCLEALGYSVLREGNILEMVGLKLSVEEACSGIRSLIAIFFMCVLYNFFFVRGKSMRTFLLVMAIPIAILGNAGRIVASGIAGQFNHVLVEGTAHEAFGYVTVLVAALGCVGLHVGIVHLQKFWRSHHV